MITVTKNAAYPVKIVLLFIAFLSFAELLAAQTILLQEAQSDKAPVRFGMNEKWYLHLYFGYGFVAGPNLPGSEILFGNSGGFRYGLRYKRKLNAWCSLGSDIAYHGTNYSFKQSASKTFADAGLHKIEKLSTSAFELSFFSRINFDPNRGDYMGIFLDVGIAYNRNIEIEHSTVDDLPNGNRVEIKTTRLGYANKDNWLALARLGRNNYILTASYRLSSVFNTNTYSELPPLIIGIEFGFY